MSTIQAQPADLAHSTPARALCKLLCEVYWRVPASAITQPDAAKFLAGRAGDCSIVCRIEQDEGSGNTATAAFSLDASGDRTAIGTACRAIVVRDGPLLHIDAHDDSGARTLALTLRTDPPPRVLYAVACVWGALGVAGGRYEPATLSTLSL